MEPLRRRIRRWRNGLESEFTDPKTFFKKACSSVSKYTAICGWERFEANYTRLNVRFIFLMVDIFFYMVVSIWCFKNFWGQRMEFIFCFVTFGLSFQGLVKAYIYSHDTIYDLLQYNMKRFENPKKIPEIHTSLMKTASWCTISVKLIAPAYFTLAAFTVIFSVVISAFNRRFELPFGFFIPGVDRTTWVGYLLNLAFHTLQAFEAGAGLLATDLCFFNLMINAIGQLDVLIIGLKKLGEAATSDELAETELLNDIIEKHVEHVKYLSAMESHMKAGYFINNVCLITELVTCLHVVLTNDEIWFTGISLAICYSFQLVIPCFMGTFLSSKNDELIREIYNIPWNELPIPAQHSLQLLLHAAQTPVTLSDGFAPIDLDSFLEIYKKIYSYLAMIQNIN
uniref:Odorant receptor n=1 Tax=Culex quinquefasciatus TaxID=7176 RepID=A0A1S4J5E2_CULQU